MGFEQQTIGDSAMRYDEHLVDRVSTRGAHDTRSTLRPCSASGWPWRASVGRTALFGEAEAADKDLAQVYYQMRCTLMTTTATKHSSRTT